MTRKFNQEFAQPTSQRGVAAVELAFILPILLIMLSGVIEYGRALWYYDALAKGARDAARYLSTRPADDLFAETSDTSTTRAIVANTAGQAGVTGFDRITHLSVSCAPTSCDSAASVTTVTVAISYPFEVGGWISLFRPSSSDAPSTFTATLVPHVTMRYMQ
jgi:Flp pilus assembly protein TadG